MVGKMFSRSECTVSGSSDAGTSSPLPDEFPFRLRRLGFLGERGGRSVMMMVVVFQHGGRYQYALVKQEIAPSELTVTVVSEQRFQDGEPQTSPALTLPGSQKPPPRRRRRGRGRTCPVSLTLAPAARRG